MSENEELRSHGGLYKVYCGQVANQTTAEELKDLFQRFGNIPEFSYRPEKGFAFVFFENEADAQEAIKNLNGFELHNQQLKVQASHHEPGGRSGFNGGPMGKKPFSIRNPGEGTCFICGQEGHWKNECPQNDGRGQDDRRRGPRDFGNRGGAGGGGGFRGGDDRGGSELISRLFNDRPERPSFERGGPGGGGFDRSRDRGPERLDRGGPERLDRGLDRRGGPPDRLLDRGIDRGMDRGIDRILDRGIDRGVDRGLDRGIDRGIDRGLDRGIDRGIDRDFVPPRRDYPPAGPIGGSSSRGFDDRRRGGEDYRFNPYSRPAISPPRRPRSPLPTRDPIGISGGTRYSPARDFPPRRPLPIDDYPRSARPGGYDRLGGGGSDRGYAPPPSGRDYPIGGGGGGRMMDQPPPRRSSPPRGYPRGGGHSYSRSSPPHRF